MQQKNANVFWTDMQAIQTVCQTLWTDFFRCANGWRTDNKWFTPSNG